MKINLVYSLSKKKNQSDFQEKGIDGKILKHNFLDMPEWFSNFEYVNCWHMNNHEPNTMWNKYAFGNRGIAIQSTYKKLRDSFVNTSESINIGIINYIDYEKTEIKWGNMLEIITHKRINFSDERELRAILVNTHTTQESSGHVKIPKGHNISVDLEELIESVIIAPSVPNWIYDLVCSILGKFSLDKPVLKSKLDDLPPTL